jgi:hypothetical protein
MEYDCQTAPFDKLIVTSSGTSMPLCNDCRAPDCSNPIKEQTVSQRGINVKMRLWVVNNVVRQVTACKGYIGDQHVFLPNA